MLFRYKNVACQRQHHKEPLDEPKTVSNNNNNNNNNIIQLGLVFRG